MHPDRSLQEVLDAAVPFALPLRRAFRGTVEREGMLIRGPSGWGEFAPFDDYSDEAAACWLASALEAAYGDFPFAVRGEIAVNAIIPDVGSADAAALAREAVLERGCRTVKIKVGSPAAEKHALKHGDVLPDASGKCPAPTNPGTTTEETTTTTTTTTTSGD